MLRLDFTLADLSLPQQRETTRRVSISGVQDKVQLHRQGMRFVPVASGGVRRHNAPLADEHRAGRRRHGDRSPETGREHRPSRSEIPNGE